MEGLFDFKVVGQQFALYNARGRTTLEVVGGPQPPRPIRFALNNSRIASVEPNALITSSNLGYTSITGTMDAGHERSSRSTVVLHVVSLAGIRAIASTQIAEKGAYVSVRVNGLDEHESPFSFGGALYPFKVTWTVSHPGVLQIIHPFGSSISETDDNRFAVWLKGCNPGSAIVKSEDDKRVNVSYLDRNIERITVDAHILNAERTASL
ncbi:hypothetical protein ANCCEY_12238 [Ancylostoma ceylanicum]|uniref:NUP210 Ig-like domain-containing protein n=1 Tax=Ancylostoma ceylanicum TaxID=53326 RepID=A0A0D6L9P1_9BILA|nr:hypothetical protein ANCCEY_12238 [Ancylostoma ceylanicum]